MASSPPSSASPGPRASRTAIPREEAGSQFGWLGPIVMVDHPASSTLTQKQLGWRPVQPALIPDLDEGHYFGG